MPPNKELNIVFNGITTSTNNNLEILNQNTKYMEFVLSSSCKKAIGEGVGTNNAKMVVFMGPKQSYVEIIQTYQ